MRVSGKTCKQCGNVNPVSTCISGSYKYVNQLIGYGAPVMQQLLLAAYQQAIYLMPKVCSAHF